MSLHRPPIQDTPLPSYPDLPGKVALVTGLGQHGNASSKENWGNGAATAYALARSGVKVFGCDLRIDAAEETRKRILSLIPDAVIHVKEADVTSSDACAALVAACLKEHGRIDILVNNVGMARKGGPVELTEEGWDAQMNINLKSVFLMTHHALPVMEKTAPGSVINLGSIAGMRYIGKPQCAYAASKAAVSHFTKHTSVIYASKRIRLNTVVPGLMHTPLLTEHVNMYGGDYEKFIQLRHKQVPSGEMGTSTDVANAVLFLSSTVASGYMTGQDLVIDGGMTSATGSVSSGMVKA